MNRLSACVLMLAALLTGCQYFEDINAQAFRAYHAVCWQETVNAYASRKDDVVLPTEPPTPRMCEERIVPAYHGIPAAAEAERESWRHVRSQSQTSLQFVAEMLEVLASRDVLNIEHLAPQIDTYVEEHQAQRDEWRTNWAGIMKSVNELNSAWK